MSEQDVPAPDPTGPTLDLTVQVPGNLILRGRDIRPADSTVALGDLNVTVGGDFSIRQVPGGQPVLLGTVTAVRGTYGFQGRRFERAREMGRSRSEASDRSTPRSTFRPNVSSRASWHT